MSKSLASILAVCATACLLAGCDKKVNLTFVNATQEIRDVELTVPGEGRVFVGTASGQGGRVSRKVKLDKDSLPATLAWQAGDLDGRFTVDKRTEDKLMIPIDRFNVGPIDKNTEVEIKETVEIKDRKVRQGTVVE